MINKEIRPKKVNKSTNVFKFVQKKKKKSSKQISVTGLDPHGWVISGHIEHLNGPEPEQAEVNKTSRWQKRGFEETMSRKAAADFCYSP